MVNETRAIGSRAAKRREKKTNSGAIEQIKGIKHTHTHPLGREEVKTSMVGWLDESVYSVCVGNIA